MKCPVRKLLAYQKGQPAIDRCFHLLPFSIGENFSRICAPDVRRLIRLLALCNGRQHHRGCGDHQEQPAELFFLEKSRRPEGGQYHPVPTKNPNDRDENA